MFTGPEFTSALLDVGITHVVWLPDTTIGPWEAALEVESRLSLIRVCREGESWPLAAGLLLGGKRPLVVMQSTGLFESGDSLRNVLFDLKLPVFALIGVRNGLVIDSRDSARTFCEPVVQAWGLDSVAICTPADKPRLAEHYRACRQMQRPGIALLMEGAMQ